MTRAAKPFDGPYSFELATVDDHMAARAPTPDPAVMRDYIDRLTRFFIDKPEWIALAEEARGYIAALTDGPASDIERCAAVADRNAEQAKARAEICRADPDRGSHLDCLLEAEVSRKLALAIRALAPEADEPSSIDETEEES